MIMELQEASQINQGLQPTNVSRTTTVVHDMKAIVKTWKLVSKLILIIYVFYIIGIVDIIVSENLCAI